MAKKFVRGITGVKNIKKQGLDTNNVNDLLSDGQYNYIHRKKGKSEEYHNLTDNIKTIQSDNTDLLTVTNYNNTSNSATIRPKHDSQKEQLLESANNTIVITHGKNATGELTNVDVNPKKVLTHDNLLTSYGISKKTSENNTTLGIEYTRVDDGFDLNNLYMGRIRAGKFSNAPQENTFYFVSAFSEGTSTIQEATALSYPNKTYRRLRDKNVWGKWREQVGDKSDVDNLLAKKQNMLTSNDSIGIVDTGLMQLYSYKMGYSNSMEADLNIYAKTVKKDTNLTGNPKLEYHFTAKLNSGVRSTTIPLKDNDKTYFRRILINYGETNGSTQTAMINGLIFSLSGSDLTISRDNATYNQVVSFSDIIDQ